MSIILEVLAIAGYFVLVGFGVAISIKFMSDKGGK